MKNFRATLWFKKGDLDADLAQAAGPDDPGAVDLLPVEDRYLDDGSLTCDDTAAYTLRTGGTQCMAALPDAPGAGDVGVLVHDIKGGRLRPLLLLGASLAACAALVALLV